MTNTVNLYDQTLSKDQLDALSKGLKFCPTPGAPDPGESVEDQHKILTAYLLLNTESLSYARLVEDPLPPLPWRQW